MQSNYGAEFIELTKSRGETYALFARLLREEISPELLHGLRSMREGAHDPKAPDEGQILLDRYLSVTALLEDDQAVAELATDFASLFLSAGNRPAHPYESVYTSPERLLMQKARDQVRQIYAAAGLNRSGDCREPEDHIALEMAFMHHLCIRTAAAIEVGDREAVQNHLQSQREFLEDHLLLWVPQFCQDLVRNAETDFYRALGYLIRDFLELEKGLIAELGSN